MATGALDANGVYQYGEDDPVSPLSDYMNLGQSSVSARIGELAAAVATPPIEVATFGRDGLWAAAPQTDRKTTLTKRTGRWVLQLWLVTANTGGFSAGPAPLGVLPTGARPANHKVDVGTYQPAVGAAPAVCPVELRPDGVVLAHLPALASQPAGQIEVHGTFVWDAA